MAARFALATAALSLVVFAGSTAEAQRKKQAAKSDIARRVDTHLKRGIEFYAEKQYELAIVEFRAGFAIDPRPDFLFALAQAERLSGDCRTAVVYYKRFLETKPGENQQEAARVNMKRCDRALESGPSGRPKKPTPKAMKDAEGTKRTPRAMPVGSLMGDDRSAGRPWYRDSVGSSLLIGGLVALGVGTGFWVASSSAEATANAAGNLDEFRAQMDRASSRKTISVASLVVSAGLISAGLLRLALRKRPSSRRSARRFVVAAAPRGIVVGLVGRF